MMKIYDKKLAYPYFIWMVLFTVVPLIIVVYYALTDGSGNFTIANLTSVSGYGSVFARSLLLALVATVICLVIAFPVGYFLSRLRVNKQHIMLMLVMLPMWMNFLLRTYAWMGLLSINGPVNAVLGFFGLGPYTMLNTSGAVVLGMVYNYVPYMILPLYTSMTKIDQSLVEAAQDLGASTTQTLFRVLIPMAEMNQAQREEELARREALLAQREAQLEKEQAELAAAKAQSAERKKTLLDNNDPNFVNPKEKLYDKFPLTVHQMDIIIGVLFALILLFLVLGMTHTSFFGLFGG